jgi:signal transduction histidine kinase
MKWLGLRSRIVIALVAVAAGACLALTVSTTQWALSEHQSAIEQQIGTSVELDLGRVSSVLRANPEAGAADFAFLTGAASSRLPAEALLVPLPSRTTLVDPGLAFVYVDVADIDLLQPTPHCVQPPITAWMEELGPGEADVWTETCGDYVIGYGEVLVDQPGENYAWLVVQAVSRGVEDDPLWELREVLAGNSLWIVMGAVIVAVLLAAMVAYPLRRARTMAEAVAGGDLGVRLPVRGRDEVGLMSVAVNTMADRLTGKISELEQANETQRRFVSDVAHELRTPTAALLASAEALEHPETKDAAAALVVPQLRRLAGLTEDLLEISRLDAGRAQVQASQIDLMDLVSEVIDDCGAPEHVQLIGCFPLEVSTDPARLQVIVRNLVANGLQHGAPPVTIRAEQSEGHVTLSVTDTGGGVPPALGERVFDRFVRGDEARHGSSSGLGLAIAAENARLLGGTLTLDSDRRTFLLVLPG